MSATKKDEDIPKPFNCYFYKNVNFATENHIPIFRCVKLIHTKITY